MLDCLKSLNIVRLDDVAGKVRFAVTTTELDRRETGGFGVTVVRTFEQVAQETYRPGKTPVPPPSEPSPSAPDAEHLAYAENRLHQLETLGVDALSPNDPMFALCGYDKDAAVAESIKLVANHVVFYTNEIARKLAAPKAKRGRKPKPNVAAEAPQTVAEPPPAETHPDSAAEDAKREAGKSAKAAAAQDQQSELAAKLQAAQQQGFKW